MLKLLQQRGPFPIPGNKEDGAEELQVGAQTLVLPRTLAGSVTLAHCCATLGLCWVFGVG